MTVSQLLTACATGAELADLLEYDRLEPPLSRRDMIQLFGDLLAMTHNAHASRPLRAEDFYPELRPGDWQERQKRRVQLEDQRLRAAAARDQGTDGRGKRSSGEGNGIQGGAGV